MTALENTGESYQLDISHRAPDDWSDLLSRDPAAEYTQTGYWTEAVSTHLPDARAVWLSLRRDGLLVGGVSLVERTGSKQVKGMMPGRRRLESSLGGTTGGPVVSHELEAGEQDRVFNHLVEGLTGLDSGPLGTCAMVLGPSREKRFGPLMRRRSGWVRKDAPTAAVSLEGGIDQVEKSRLVKTKRSERNRGLRRGAELFLSDEVELLREYYRIYARAADHWGIEPTPLALLEALLRDPDDRVFFICARFEGKVIGGHLNLHFGGRVLPWNGVTDPALSRSHFPSTLCFWGDMVEACRRQADWLDMGGSGGVDTLVGFKKYFGAEMQMRGLYLRESRAAAILRRGRDLWRSRPGTAAPARWHDDAPGSDSGATP
ncbi:MAG: GNAT family N-acetyltransferase [Candidatus Krumholzibacteriota bacterium]